MAIEIKELSFSYGERKIFDNLSLTIQDGEMVHIKAPSGRGKTTLLRILLGLERAYKGTVNCNSDKRFGVVFQEDRLLEELTAAANVRLVAKASVEEIKTILSSVGLSDSLNKRVKELSGGERRRLSIVRALLAKSDIIIMDEPFNGIDDDMKEKVKKLISELIGDKTLIIVSHEDIDIPARKCRVIEIDK